MSGNLSTLLDFNVTSQIVTNQVTDDPSGLDVAFIGRGGNLSQTNNSCPLAEDAGEVDKTFRFIVYGVLVTIIGILGMAGNIISITILSRPKMRSSINCCLIGLTSFDMIVTSTSVVMFGLQELCEYTGAMRWYGNGFYQRAIPFVYPLGLIAQTGSVYLTVTVTVERYVAVCRPLQARYLCTYGRAKIYVGIVALFSVIYNLPRFFEVTYSECILDGALHSIVNATALRLNTTYIQVYIMWMYLFVMYLVPFLSLIIFNSFIYSEVRKANNERQRLSRLQRKEIGLAIMLLVVVSVFFLCNALAFVVNVLELLTTPIDRLTEFSNLLVTINSSVNFIIYCIFGQKFRKVFLRMFCSRVMAASAVTRENTMADSAIYVNSAGVTNGGNTETIRLTSWSGNQHSLLLNTHDAHGRPCPSAPGGRGSRFIKRGKQFNNYNHMDTPSSQCFD